MHDADRRAHIAALHWSGLRQICGWQWQGSIGGSRTAASARMVMCVLFVPMPMLMFMPLLTGACFRLFQTVVFRVVRVLHGGFLVRFVV
ncbi:MAG: hypothetical protein ACJ8I3_10005 [Paraburkholderia graminis]